MDSRLPCPCGSGQPLADCCAPYHQGLAAPTAERLMRSRYTAYVLGQISYLQATTLPAQQAGLDLAAITEWSQSSRWLALEVEEAQSLGRDRAFVRFSVRWQDPAGQEHDHQERSIFVYRGQRWYFLDPTVPLTASRNDPCPCLSGQKFKKCCAHSLS